MATEKILIIDDSPVEARIASKILTGAGYSTTIIHDGQEALGVARQWRPDLILLDVTMPKVDGYQVCQQLKTDPDTHSIPIALYTFRDQFLDYLRGIEAGADDFIIKALSGDDFLARIKKILAEGRVSLLSPAESLNLNVILPLAKVQDRQELLPLLYGTFNKRVREGMSVILGAYVTGVLVNLASEKAAIRFPFFRGFNQTHVSGLMFDSEAIRDVPAIELINGFQTFNHELYQLVIKLTRPRVNGAKEARAITSAFQDMVNELHARYTELSHQLGTRNQKPETSDPRPTTRDPSPLSPDCTLDTSSNLIHCNDDLVRLLGYSKNELIGQPFTSLLTDEGRQALNQAFDRLMGQGAAQARLQLKSNDGTLIYADACFTALYDSQGHFAVIRCGLEIIPASRLLQQYKEENERLKQALHNLSGEFSTLASTISHDLRQPLHAVLMVSQFLEGEYRGRLDEQAQEYIQSIQQASTKMKTLIEDVVHYARITSSSNAYEEVNLAQLVEEVREGRPATRDPRPATIHVMGELPTVTCDRERFMELFTELITNAIKFNDKAQPMVEVGLAKEDPDGYTFYVKDNGIGIEEPDHESIFRLFHRLHKPEEYEGTGAGLAVCRRIVQSHGGRIWVRSQLGAGATFFFTLPREIPSI